MNLMLDHCSDQNIDLYILQTFISRTMAQRKQVHNKLSREDTIADDHTEIDQLLNLCNISLDSSQEEQVSQLQNIVKNLQNERSQRLLKLVAMKKELLDRFLLVRSAQNSLSSSKSKHRGNSQTFKSRSPLAGSSGT